MTVPRAAAYVVALLFAGGVAAQSAPKSFAHAIRVRAAAEECVKLSAGASIRYVFESSAPVEFNIHFHRGDSVEYPVKRFGRAGGRAFHGAVDRGVLPHVD